MTTVVHAPGRLSGLQSSTFSQKPSPVLLNSPIQKKVFKSTFRQFSQVQAPTVSTLMSLHAAHQRLVLRSAVVTRPVQASKNVVGNYQELVASKLEQYSAWLVDTASDDYRPGLSWIHQQFPRMRDRLSVLETAGESSLTVCEKFFADAKASGKFNNKTNSEIAKLYLQYADRYLVLFNALKLAHFDEIHERTSFDILEDIEAKREQLEILFNSTDPDVGYRMATTAHPTFLETLAVNQIKRNLSEAIRTNNEYEIQQLLIQLAQTSCGYKEKRTALQEARGMLRTIGPSIYKALRNAQVGLEDKMQENLRVGLRSLYKLGTWALFDRDGSPKVKAALTHQFALEKSQFVIRQYLEELDALWNNSFKDLKDNQEVKSLFDTIRTRLFFKLEEVEDVLLPLQKVNAGDKEDKEALPKAIPPIGLAFGYEAYASADQLRIDLQELYALVGEKAQGLRKKEIQELVAAVKIFGLHLSSGEIRQNVGQHEKALHEIFNKILPGFNYSELTEDEKLQALALLINKGDSSSLLLEGKLSDLAAIAKQIQFNQIFSWELTAPTQEVLDTLKIIPEMHDQLGEAACDSYIMSNTYAGKLNVRELLALQKLAHPGKEVGEIGVNIIPLIETPTDLAKENLERILDGIFDPSDPFYAEIIKAKGKIEIMFGPSDSSIRIGTPAALWAIYKAVYMAKSKMEQLNQIEGFERVKLQFYFGSGGATSRGGLNVEETLKLIKAELESLFMRKTVQGGEAYSRYGDSKSGEYYALKAMNALLEGVRDKDSIKLIPKEDFDAIDALMTASGGCFEELFKVEAFADYYFGVTPALIGHNFGSRPDKHVDRAQGNPMEAVRAIPAVENFARIAQFVYLWYGIGSSLKNLSSEHFARLQELARAGSSSQFNTYLEAVRYGLAYTDMLITKHLEEGSPCSDTWNRLNEEYKLTRQKFTELTGAEPVLTPLEEANKAIVDSVRLPVAGLIQYAMNEIIKFRKGKSSDEPPGDGEKACVKIIQKALSAMACSTAAS